MKKNKKNVLKMVLVGVGVLGLTGATIGIIKNLNHDHEDVEKAKSIDLNIENITFSKINESKYVFATLENKEVGDKILWKTSSSKISLTPSNDSYSCNLVRCHFSLIFFPKMLSCSFFLICFYPIKLLSFLLEI